MEITICVGNYEPVEAESYFVEFWYNRHDRLWVVTVYDNLDRQCDCQSCPDKAWRDGVIKEFSAKYNTQDIRHIK